MSTNLRRLGVYGENLPVKRTLQIAASDFLIGGIMGRFERAYNKAFEVRNIAEFQEIFGNHVTSSFYGWDVVRGFFENATGVDAKLNVAAYVGNSAGSIDAVVAARDVADDGAADSLRVRPGYLEEPQYGVGGNRIGSKLTAATRFTTLASAQTATTGVSFAELDSVIGIKVGDIVRFDGSGGTPGVEYHVITAVDETLKRVTWTGDFSSGGAILEIGDTVDVPGFTVQAYYKDVNGVETEVDADLGKVVMTMESAVTDFYAPNVWATSRWLVLSDLSSASTLDDRSFTSDSAAVYPIDGADGTAPTVAADWANSLALFDDLPIRMLTNPEATLAAIQSAGETYCAARDDTPIWLYTVAENQTQAQLKVIGSGYQRSNEVDGVIVANWLKVEDPFSTSVVAPPRNVPNVGHVMGLWVRSIAVNGVHVIPAVKTLPLRGVVGIVGSQFLDDFERTDIAESGVNLIQDLTGIGVVLRNFFTPSTDVAYQFANGLLQRNFIKASIVDSLQTSENLPNSINRIKADRMAALQFLYRLWQVGSTGNVPVGETFGRTQDDEGNESQPEEHFEVQADLVNNPQASINAGERSIDIWFTYPAPAGSIRIGVGILLLS